MNTITFKKAIVEVDTSTLERSSNRSITGIITIRAGGVSFPDTRWYDFPVIILSWWLEPVSSVLQDKTRVWNCRFMDGPISVRLEQQHEDSWTLLGLRNDRVEFTTSVSCRAFIDSLLETARQVLRECQRRGWQSRDVQTLDSAVKAIEYDMI